MKCNIIARKPRNRLNTSTSIRRSKRSGAVVRAAAWVDTLEDRQLLSAAMPATQAALVQPAHIVVVVEEDRAANAIGNVAQAPYSDMPYFNQLASTGLVYNNSHGLNTTGQDGQMNYLALYSGSTQGVTDDMNNGIFDTPTLASSLSGANLSFGGYAESLPYAGDMNDNYAANPANPADDDLYTRAYNPMAQFDDAGAGVTNAQVNQPFSSFPTTASGFAALPTVSFVIPNTLHNTHGSNDTDPYATDPSAYDLLRQNADTWLQQNLDAYVQWAKQNNSLLIVTDDEGDRANNFNAGFATIVNGSSNLFVPGVDTTNVTPYSILGAIEDMYGLPKLGNTATAPDLDTTSQGLLGAPTVVPSASATTLKSSAANSVAGQAVILTAAVSAVAPATGTPTGSVNFMDGSTLLATAKLNSSGTATFTTTALAVASHTITAVYSDDAIFAASASPALTQIVARDATTTLVKSSANPSVAGQSVTLTATVAPAAPGSGTPTGSVQFSDGVSTLGTVALNGSGAATLTLPAPSVGSHSITAAYLDDVNFAASSSVALAQSVVRDSSKTALQSSTNPAMPGQSVTFTATVSAAAPGSGIPTGAVNFMDGASLLGSVMLDGSGNAVWTTSTLATAAHSITAVYADDANFGPSTSPIVVESVGQTATAVALKSSANPSVAGQGVTFTASVTSTGSTTSIPAGQVNFLDGTTLLATVSLDGSGNATYATSALSVSSHSITAAYVGGGVFGPSASAALSEKVGRDSTTTGLTSSANPSVAGQSVTLTATVSPVAPGSGTPTGNVKFMDGSTTLATVALVSGKATYTTSMHSVGSHAITAAYLDDANFAASASAALTQVVNRDATTTAVTSSATPSVAGQSVTLTATVSPVAPGSGTPTGNVKFMDGSTTLATVALSSGKATFTTSMHSVGTHTIKAVYADDANFAASTSAALTQVVTRDATKTVVTSSAKPSVAGQSVTFTATVSAVAPGSGTPTGNVKFMDGSTVLATVALSSSGKATYATSRLSVASHTITAVYVDDANFAASTSAALTQTVNRDATATSLKSSDSSAVSKESVTFTATVAAVAPGSGTPTGYIRFMDGSAILATVLLNSSAKATFATAKLSIASHTITAVYVDDANFAASTSPALTQRVIK
ncbi:MAG TPA: Ig-like domain repeat protein [Tepidisphaeraceae bacterium]|jgi:hypothetical protein|nr:Ig-like domain repeat protein [Tepidisphaeraceae bacterium]